MAEPAAAGAAGEPAGRLPDAARDRLVRLARAALEASVRGLPDPAVEPDDGPPRGVFVTLWRDGELRGCIGTVAGVRALGEAVAAAARSAALCDPRFPPVAPGELDRLRLEVSVLSPLEPIEAARVEPGRHGLLVTRGARRGLLLPRVALENGWDRETFLAHTCVKAGLEPGAWRSGARLEAFTAEVFGEPPGPR